MRSNPLLCPPEEKAEREAANTVAQLDFLTELVKDRGARQLRESHILELQRIAVDGLYPCGGRYREAHFTLKISDSDHQPPEPALVPVRVQEMVDACNRKDVPANRRMAYALWYSTGSTPSRAATGEPRGQSRT